MALPASPIPMAKKRMAPTQLFKDDVEALNPSRPLSQEAKRMINEITEASPFEQASEVQAGVFLVHHLRGRLFHKYMSPIRYMAWFHGGSQNVAHPRVAAEEGSDVAHYLAYKLDEKNYCRVVDCQIKRPTLETTKGLVLVLYYVKPSINTSTTTMVTSYTDEDLGQVEITKSTLKEVLDRLVEFDVRIDVRSSVKTDQLGARTQALPSRDIEEAQIGFLDSDAEYTTVLKTVNYVAMNRTTKDKKRFIFQDLHGVMHRSRNVKGVEKLYTIKMPIFHRDRLDKVALKDEYYNIRLAWRLEEKYPKQEIAKASNWSNFMAEKLYIEEPLIQAILTQSMLSFSENDALAIFTEANQLSLSSNDPDAAYNAGAKVITGIVNLLLAPDPESTLLIKLFKTATSQRIPNGTKLVAAYVYSKMDLPTLGNPGDLHALFVTMYEKLYAIDQSDMKNKFELSVTIVLAVMGKMIQAYEVDNEIASEDVSYSPSSSSSSSSSEASLGSQEEDSQNSENSASEKSNIASVEASTEISELSFLSENKKYKFFDDSITEAFSSQTKKSVMLIDGIRSCGYFLAALDFLQGGPLFEADYGHLAVYDKKGTILVPTFAQLLERTYKNLGLRLTDAVDAAVLDTYMKYLREEKKYVRVAIGDRLKSLVDNELPQHTLAAGVAMDLGGDELGDDVNASRDSEISSYSSFDMIDEDRSYVAPLDESPQLTGLGYLINCVELANKYLARDRKLDQDNIKRILNAEARAYQHHFRLFDENLTMLTSPDRRNDLFALKDGVFSSYFPNTQKNLDVMDNYLIRVAFKKLSKDTYHWVVGAHVVRYEGRCKLRILYATADIGPVDAATSFDDFLQNRKTITLSPAALEVTTVDLEVDEARELLYTMDKNLLTQFITQPTTWSTPGGGLHLDISQSITSDSMLIPKMDLMFHTTSDMNTLFEKHLALAGSSSNRLLLGSARGIALKNAAGNTLVESNRTLYPVFPIPFAQASAMVYIQEGSFGWDDVRQTAAGSEPIAKNPLVKLLREGKIQTKKGTYTALEDSSTPFNGDEFERTPQDVVVVTRVLNGTYVTPQHFENLGETGRQSLVNYFTPIIKRIKALGGDETTGDIMQLLKEVFTGDDMKKNVASLQSQITVAMKAFKTQKPQKDVHFRFVLRNIYLQRLTKDGRITKAKGRGWSDQHQILNQIKRVSPYPKDQPLKQMAIYQIRPWVLPSLEFALDAFALGAAMDASFNAHYIKYGGHFVIYTSALDGVDFQKAINNIRDHLENNLPALFPVITIVYNSGIESAQGNAFILSVIGNRPLLVLPGTGDDESYYTFTPLLGDEVAIDDLVAKCFKQLSTQLPTHFGWSDMLALGGPYTTLASEDEEEEDEDEEEDASRESGQEEVVDDDDEEEGNVANLYDRVAMHARIIGQMFQHTEQAKKTDVMLPPDKITGIIVSSFYAPSIMSQWKTVNDISSVDPRRVVPIKLPRAMLLANNLIADTLYLRERRTYELAQMAANGVLELDDLYNYPTPGIFSAALSSKTDIMESHLVEFGYRSLKSIDPMLDLLRQQAHEEHISSDAKAKAKAKPQKNKKKKAKPAAKKSKKKTSSAGSKSKKKQTRGRSKSTGSSGSKKKASRSRSKSTGSSGGKKKASRSRSKSTGSSGSKKKASRSRSSSASSKKGTRGSSKSPATTKKRGSSKSPATTPRKTKETSSKRGSSKSPATTPRKTKETSSKSPATTPRKTKEGSSKRGRSQSPSTPRADKKGSSKSPAKTKEGSSKRGRSQSPSTPRKDKESTKQEAQKRGRSPSPKEKKGSSKGKETSSKRDRSKSPAPSGKDKTAGRDPSPSSDSSTEDRSDSTSPDRKKSVLAKAAGAVKSVKKSVRVPSVFKKRGGSAATPEDGDDTNNSVAVASPTPTPTSFVQQSTPAPPMQQSPTPSVVVVQVPQQQGPLPTQPAQVVAAVPDSQMIDILRQRQAMQQEQRDLLEMRRMEANLEAQQRLAKLEEDRQKLELREREVALRQRESSLNAVPAPATPMPSTPSAYNMNNFLSELSRFRF